MKKIIIIAIVGIIQSFPALALEQIVRPWRAPRTAAMGGTFVTTGLYDQNFFGNPAGASKNPVWKFSILDISAEANQNAVALITNPPSFGSTSEVLSTLTNSIGKNEHVRVQSAFPAFYWPNVGGGYWSYQFGILMSTQADVMLRKSYNIDATAIADVGPALTISYQPIEDRSLTVGLTAHMAYRLATQQGLGFLDLLQGTSLSVNNLLKRGAHVDFSLGTLYELPWKFEEVTTTLGASVNNVLGGKYKMINIPFPSGASKGVPAQNRAYNVGVSLSRPTLWIFDKVTLAVELTDIGNNKNGSFWRLMHMGMEWNLGILALQGGLNQGYWTAGLRLDAVFATIELATEAEEMSLVSGGFEDRRYIARISLEI